jgi:hypothetical protein
MTGAFGAAATSGALVGLGLFATIAGAAFTATAVAGAIAPLLSAVALARLTATAVAGTSRSLQRITANIIRGACGIWLKFCVGQGSRPDAHDRDQGDKTEFHNSTTHDELSFGFMLGSQ